MDWDTDILELLEKVGCSDGEDTGSVQAQGNEVYTYRRGTSLGSIPIASCLLVSFFPLPLSHSLLQLRSLDVTVTHLSFAVFILLELSLISQLSLTR